jgi:uncharacterized protein (TIGR02266 family)
MSSNQSVAMHSPLTTLSADAIERRRTPRRKLEAEVGFASDTNFYAGFTEDISEGGLFVATVMLLEVGSRVTLSFALPDGHEITTSGVVRWLRDPHAESADCAPGMGVQFEHVEPEDLEHIRRFVALREPLFFEA